MANTEYKFTPCDCCAPPPFSEPTFSGLTTYTSCEDKCGFLQSNLSYPIVTPQRFVDASQGFPPFTCSYTIPANTVNVEQDQCIYYRKSRIIDDYTVIQCETGENGSCGTCYPDYVCDTILEGVLNPDGTCNTVFSTGPLEGDCQGLLGSDRHVVWEYENPIEDCEYKLDVLPFSPNPFPITSGPITSVGAYEFISRIGNVKEKATTDLTKIIHQPTATCYLKVWVRSLVQDYIIEPRLNDTWTPPTEPPPFTEDPNCVEGGPSWENNSCYKAVVDNDPFCCDEEWDGTCQDAYDACLGVPPINSGPCDGPFNPVGEKYEGNIYTYEWNGSGRPCYAEEDKLPTEEENKIEGDIDWHFETGALEEKGVGKEFEVEIKWSFVEGYEPKWPSERYPNDCKQDGFPRC